MSEQKLRHGVIAFLDVLGVKEMGNKEEAELVRFAESFDTFGERMRKGGMAYAGALGSGESVPKFELTVISDTMVITGAFKDGHSKALEAFTLNGLGHLCAYLVLEAFVNKIYLRGGISIGSFYQKNNLIIGKALSEVARYYEEPQWIGVSLAPSAHYVYSTADPWIRMEGHDIAGNPFVKYDLLPLKIGIEQDAWVVAWPRFLKQFHDILRRNDTKENNYSIRYDPSKHRETIMSYCNDANLSTALKWRNTLKFWDAVIQDMASS